MYFERPPIDPSGRDISEAGLPIAFPDSQILFVHRGKRRTELVADFLLVAPASSRLPRIHAISLTLAGTTPRETSRTYRSLRAWTDGRAVHVEIVMARTGPVVDLRTSCDRTQLALVLPL